MVDVSKLRPGDWVVFDGAGNPGQAYIDEFQSASGKREPIVTGTLFQVADPVVSNWGRHYVILASSLGKNNVVECSVDFLNYLPSYIGLNKAVDEVHDMRNAGPPAPAACSCDIVSLMRFGCLKYVPPGL